MQPQSSYVCQNRTHQVSRNPLALIFHPSISLMPEPLHHHPHTVESSTSRRYHCSCRSNWPQTTQLAWTLIVLSKPNSHKRLHSLLPSIPNPRRPSSDLVVLSCDPPERQLPCQVQPSSTRANHPTNDHLH